MRRPVHNLILCLVAILAGVWFTSCNNDTVYDSVPSPITKFISQYYPGSDISSFHSSKEGIYTVTVKDGPTITFNKDYSWTDIDANGNTLPEVMLYDQLPPALYEYLQSTQATHSVYSATRDTHQYVLKLQDSSLTYDIATAQITGIH